MQDVKNISLRVPAELAEQLTTIARVENESINQAIVESISERIDRKRADKDFQARLKQAVERNREALALLADK